MKGRLRVVPAKKQKQVGISLARNPRFKVGSNSSSFSSPKAKRKLGGASGDGRQIKRRKTGGPTVQLSTSISRRVKPKTVAKRNTVTRRKPTSLSTRKKPVEISTRRSSVPENPPAQAKQSAPAGRVARKRVLQRGTEKRPRKQLIRNQQITKVTIDNESIYSAASKSTASKIAPGTMTISVNQSPQRPRAVQRRKTKKPVAKRRAVNPRTTSKPVKKVPVVVKKGPVIQTRSGQVHVIATKPTPVKKRKRRPVAPPPVTIVAPAVPDDNSSVYSYSSDDSGSDVDGTRRSRRALGPVMRAHTVTRGGHIMLRNLPEGINARMMMMELFRDDGEIINAIVHADNKGTPMGTGEIVFAKRTHAHAAIVRHTGSIWRGKKIKMTMIGQMVEVATTIESRQDRRDRQRTSKRKSRKPSRSSVRAHMLVVPPPPNTQLAEPVEQEEPFEETQAVAVAGHTVETQADQEEVAYEEEAADEEPEGEVVEEEAEEEEAEYEEVEEEEEAEEEVEADFPEDTQEAEVQETIERHGLTYAEEGPAFEYIPTEDHDANTNFHVTLKNFKEYENQLKDTPDAGIFG